MRNAGTKVSIVVLLTLVVGMGNVAVHTHDACRFLRAYQAVAQADAPTNFWERVACSLVLLRATSRQNAGDRG